MSHVGQLRTLRVIDASHEAIVLDGDDDGAIPLPRAEAPAGIEIGDAVDVFVLTDSQSRPIATTARPVVTLGHCASLRCVTTGSAGAFLDWGLPKNLLLPFAEQRRPLETGQRECVLVYLDNSGRLAASSRLDHRLDETPGGFAAWQPVSLLICQRTDLGFKAVVDDQAIGLLYRDEIFRELQVGERIRGFVKRPRADGRLDVALQPPANEVKGELAERIVDDLRTQGGSSPLTDRSSPEAIAEAYGVSKKNYKRALASLYRARRVRLDADRVVLLDDKAS